MEVYKLLLLVGSMNGIWFSLIERLRLKCTNTNINEDPKLGIFFMIQLIEFNSFYLIKHIPDLLVCSEQRVQGAWILKNLNDSWRFDLLLIDPVWIRSDGHSMWEQSGCCNAVECEFSCLFKIQDYVLYKLCVMQKNTCWWFLFFLIIFILFWDSMKYGARREFVARILSAPFTMQCISHV